MVAVCTRVSAISCKTHNATCVIVSVTAAPGPQLPLASLMQCTSPRCWVICNPCRPPQILPAGANPLEPFQGPSYYFFKCAYSAVCTGGETCRPCAHANAHAACTSSQKHAAFAVPILSTADFSLMLQLLTTRQRRSSAGVSVPAGSGAPLSSLDYCVFVVVGISVGRQKGFSHLVQLSQVLLACRLQCSRLCPCHADGTPCQDRVHTTPEHPVPTCGSHVTDAACFRTERASCCAPAARC